MNGISACCKTRGQTARAAAILALLRPVVDEIVVALDDRAEPEVGAALAPITDKLIGYPYAEHVDRTLPWLFSQCSGDRVFLIDDDEIPSAALLEALPGLAAGKPMHYWVQRRWLYPTPETYLDEPPWRPDYQLRLLTNDMRLLRFPDEMHWQTVAVGPVAYVDAPLYHADTVLNPLETRERKAERYERLAPGKRIAGRPLNDAFYLPERWEPLTTAPVPEPDLELVSRVLEAEAVPGAAPTIQVATREEIDRLWEGRTLADGDYRARLELREQPGAVVADEVRTLDVLISNLGDATWPWGPERRPEIRLTYRWCQGDAVVEGLRTAMPAELASGQSALVPLVVQAPPRPGRFRLAVDLVHEHVRWFDCGFSVDVEVLPRRLLAVTGPVELGRLASLESGLEPLLLGCEPRWTGEQAPDAGTYLLAELRKTRLAAPLLALRTIRLLLAATALRLGRKPRFAAPFLEALARAEALVVFREPGLRRRRWAERATILAAKILGVQRTERTNSS
jgi:hypothetical protein